MPVFGMNSYMSKQLLISITSFGKTMFNLGYRRSF